MPRARLMAASVWILAAMYPVPYLASGRQYIFHPGKFFCSHEAKSSLVADSIYVCICISLAVLSFCNYNVFRHLRLNAKRVQTWRANDNTCRISPEDAKLTRTLFATVLGYLICWTPVLIVDFFGVGVGVGEWSLSRGVYVMYIYVGLVSSSLNPIIYGALNRTFRQEYKKFLCFRKSVNRVQNIPGVSKRPRDKYFVSEMTQNSSQMLRQSPSLCRP